MKDSLLLGVSRHIVPIPSLLWRREVAGNARRARASLAFMSAEHHRVRDFAVLDLPRVSAPLSPEHIAASLGIPSDRVRAILDDLEKHLTFIYGNPAGEVVWAYPVTVEPTPHCISFSTGEQLYAA